jgi:hypothetical protein
MYEKASKTHLGTSPLQGASSLRMRYHPELDDCRISCSDGSVVANTFAMVQASPVLSDLFDDMSDASERVFEIPNVTCATMQRVVDLVQRKIGATDLDDMVEIREVLVAMDFLGCSTRWKKLVDRLWTLVRACPPEISKAKMLENASLLIPEHPDAFFHKFRLMCPNWQEYRTLFDAISMTPTLASVVMTQLMPFFPMPLLIHAIVTNTPRDHVYTVISGIFKIPRIGSYFHPDELMLAFDVVLRSASHDIDTSIIRAVLDSAHGVNVPTPVPRARGSMVTFHTKNTTSFSFVFDRPITRPTTVTFPSNTATFTFEPPPTGQTGQTGTTTTTGTMETSLKLHKFGETGMAVDCAFVRTTVYPRDPELDDGHASKLVAWSRVRDTWTTVEDVDHDADGEIEHTARLDVTDAVAVRVDVFWVHDPRKL